MLQHKFIHTLAYTYTASLPSVSHPCALRSANFINTKPKLRFREYVSLLVYSLDQVQQVQDEDNAQEELGDGV